MIELRNIDDYTIIKSSEPFQILSINGYVEDIDVDSDVVLKREYSYSYDNMTYSNYITLTNNVSDYAFLTNNLTSNKIWIKFKYTLLENPNDYTVTINSITLDYNPIPDTKPPIYKNFSIRNRRGTNFNKNFSFNPYAMKQAVELNRQLINSIINMYGIDVYYYRSEVIEKYGRDFLLRENIMHNLKEGKCIKIVVPGNKFPENQYNFNPLGIDFQNLPFEIHVGKDLWDTTFGEGTTPRERDVIYIPILKRIYRVNDFYLFKGMMLTETYYKLSLQKYEITTEAFTEEQTTVVEDLQDIISSYQNKFEDTNKEDSERLLNEKQLQKSTFVKDVNRKSISRTLIITEYMLENYHTKISDFYYDLSSNLDKTTHTQSMCIEYDLPVSLKNNSERTYSAWFRFNNPITEIRNIISKSLASTTLTFTINASSQYINVGDNVELSSNNNSEFFIPATILTKNNKTFTASINSTLLGLINSEFPGWTSYSSMKVKKTWKSNLLYGNASSDTIEYNNQTITYEFLTNKILFVKIGTFEKYLILDNVLESNKDYAIVISRSFQLEQFSVNIWKKQENNINLLNIFEYNQTISNGGTFTDYDNTTYNFKLIASPLHITNIRYLNTIVPKDKQIYFLNQSIVLDADTALISDNAYPRLRFEYTGKQI